MLFCMFVFHCPVLTESEQRLHNIKGCQTPFCATFLCFCQKLLQVFRNTAKYKKIYVPNICIGTPVSCISGCLKYKIVEST